LSIATTACKSVGIANAAKDAPNMQSEMDRNLADGLGQIAMEQIEPGRVTAEFEVRPAMCHSGGVAQGGYVCGWIDSTMAFAAMSLNQGMLPLSLELKTSFLAPSRPGRVFAEAWIERNGKSICFAEGVLRDEDGQILAKCTSTLRLVPRPAPTDQNAEVK
jgi:acyl-CoA thioesterase